NFINIGGVLTAVEVRTLPVSSGPAQALGAKPLKAEKSENASVGVAVQPLPQLSLTADYYRIIIRDRIVLTGNFVGAAMTAFLASQGYPGVGSARYFTNPVNTRTNGLDIIGRYIMDWGTHGVTGFTGGFNRTGTVVTHVDSTPPALGTWNAGLWGRVEKSKLGGASPPPTNVTFSARHTIRRFNAALHPARFGEIGTRGPSNPALDQTYAARWVTDANVTVPIVGHFLATVGVNNIADVYPSENISPNKNL